jgi:hypothetical protein
MNIEYDDAASARSTAPAVNDINNPGKRSRTTGDFTHKGLNGILAAGLLALTHPPSGRLLQR